MEMSWGESGYSVGENVQAAELKICPVCGALNHVKTRECFVCTWHGGFERRPEIIHTAIELLRRRYGNLSLDQLIEACDCRLIFGNSLSARFRRTLSGIRHWLFD